MTAGALAVIAVVTLAAATFFAGAAWLYRGRALGEAREVRRLRQLNRNLRERLGEIAVEDLSPADPVYDPDDPLEVQLELPAHVPPHERKA